MPSTVSVSVSLLVLHRSNASLQRPEVWACRSSCTPSSSNSGGAQLAARYQALSCDHLEWLSEDGARSMAAAGTVAVLLPGAFYFLRETRLPPIALLRQHAVPMAVSTDSNPGSSPCTSLLLMLNMACTLFRLTPRRLWLVSPPCGAGPGLAATAEVLAAGPARRLRVVGRAAPGRTGLRPGRQPSASNRRPGAHPNGRPPANLLPARRQCAPAGEHAAHRHRNPRRPARSALSRAPCGWKTPTGTWNGCMTFWAN